MRESLRAIHSPQGVGRRKKTAEPTARYSIRGLFFQLHVCVTMNRAPAEPGATFFQTALKNTRPGRAFPETPAGSQAHPARVQATVASKPSARCAACCGEGS